MIKVLLVKIRVTTSFLVHFIILIIFYEQYKVPHYVILFSLLALQLS